MGIYAKKVKKMVESFFFQNDNGNVLAVNGRQYVSMLRNFLFP